MKKSIIPISFIAVLVLGLSSIESRLSSNPNGAPVGSTGAPDGQGGMEGTCADCHGGTPNTGPHTASISIAGNPTGFSADSVYNITVKVNNQTGTAFGFQLVALNPTESTFGTLAPIGTTSKLVVGGGRTYITHRNANSSSWTFKWTAPASGLPDSIKFYAAVNETVGGVRRTYTTSLPFYKKIVTSDQELLSGGKLKLFPYQADKDLFVSGIPVSLPFATAQVISADGRILASQPVSAGGQEAVSLPSGMKAGMYFLRVSGPGYLGMARFQKI